MLFYIIAIIVFIIDQASKIVVRMNVGIYERFTWLGMEFTYIENSGMAGGFLPGYARIFGFLSILFVIFILYLRKKEDWKGPIIDISLALLVGGALGNGIDRLLFGQVTDFIIRFNGILNIADHALELGIIMLIVHEIVQWVKRRRLKKAGESEVEG